jgi:peptidoglycan/LPS O-acetylase OafA/YrhL
MFLFAAQQLACRVQTWNFFDQSAVRKEFRKPFTPGALQADASQRRRPMPLGTILLIILIVLLVGALPTWPYSGGWGYYPSGGLGLVLVIVLILLLLGRI